MKPIIHIQLPELFNWNHCIQFLKRDPHELLFHIKGNRLRKLFRWGEEEGLMEIAYLHHEHRLEIHQLAGNISPRHYDKILIYIKEWFDLNRSLRPFVSLSKNDRILRSIVSNYKGLRLIGIPDLFECMAWAIIGQQINLTFAFKLKNALIRLVETPLIFEGHEYYHFPSTSTIENLSTDTLRSIQFSRQKADYIRIVARQISNNTLSKNALLNLDSKEVEKRLTSIKGVGKWTSDYTRMKCLGDSTAFLIGDVGLQNALKRIQNLKSKPGKDEMLALSQGWKGWEAYATFYLWYYLLFSEDSLD